MNQTLDTKTLAVARPHPTFRRRWSAIGQVLILGLVTATYVLAAIHLTRTIPYATTEQNYTLQAIGWLRGQLDLPFFHHVADVGVVNGKLHLPNGPLPAVLMLPFVAIWGDATRQEIIKFLITAVNAGLLVMAGRRLRLHWIDRWWVAASFIIGSVYLWVGLGGSTGYLAQVVTTTGLLIVAVAWAADAPGNNPPAAERRLNRWWWSGMGIAFAGLCRPTTFLISLPLALLVATTVQVKEAKRRAWIGLFTPILIAGIAQAILNAARFGVPWEFGYHFYPGAQRVGKLFGFAYVPDNGYFLLLAVPQLVIEHGRLVFPYLKPDLWGMSILLTSPVLLSLIRWRPTDRTAAVWLMVTAVMLLPNFFYYGIGHVQIGYRYALDFLPFLYLMVLEPFRGRQLPVAVKLLMLAGIVVNGWMAYSYVIGA